MEMLRQIVLGDQDKERVKGVTLFEDGDEIVIRVKKDGDYGPSKSGKTKIVATTGGTLRVSGLMIGLNVNTK